MIQTWLGVAAVIIEFVGVVPYVRDIFLHKTKPERASYWIFLLLTLVTLLAQLSDGLTWASALVGASVLIGGLLAALSLKYGYGTFKKRDFISILVALVGVAFWLSTNQPIIAVGMIILVDLAGFWLVLVKSWEAPYTETMISWAASATACTLTVIAAGTWDAVQISYLLYSAIANWVLVFLLLYRRRVVLQPVAKS